MPRTRQHRSARQTALPVEGLESRVLLSATANGHTLLIEGTPEDDRIHVTQDEGQLTVNINGEEETFDASELRRIRVRGHEGNDRMVIAHDVEIWALMQGGDGDDEMVGGNGPDFMAGGPGNDRMLGRGGGDRLTGGPGNDLLRGGAGWDILAGRQGDDFLFGGKGNDILMGNPGDDHLFGGPGRDRLRGGPGDDVEVQDGPENEPPVVRDSRITIDHDTPEGEVIGRVHAHDPNRGDELHYRIVSGNDGFADDSGPFAIDAATGVITVADAGALQSDADILFELTVEVTDSEGETDQGIVQIRVVDLPSIDPVDPPDGGVDDGPIDDVFTDEVGDMLGAI